MPSDREIERVRTLARVMDDYYLDPILGFLLPGVGDLIGSLLGMYIVALAARRKMSPVVVARMLMNLAFDAVIGIVPVIGDVADAKFKANDRNLVLLTERHEVGGRATARDWAVLIGAIGAVVLVIGGVIYGLVRLIRWI
jgi:hypothetical protein